MHVIGGGASESPPQTKLAPKVVGRKERASERSSPLVVFKSADTEERAVEEGREWPIDI